MLKLTNISNIFTSELVIQFAVIFVFGQHLIPSCEVGRSFQGLVAKQEQQQVLLEGEGQLQVQGRS